MKVTLNTQAKKEALLAQAKETRSQAEDADIEVFGVYWQVRSQDRERMRQTIDTAQRMNQPPEATIHWILADNTLRATTASDLAAVLNAHTIRMGNIFAAYTAWYAGPRNQPFTVE